MKIYQVDAFTEKIFGGNPAAVCPLDFWPDDETMQAIAAENNLAETAFFVKEGPLYGLRWFTPTIEVDLCGHATLASAHVLFSHLDFTDEMIQFSSRSGVLTVRRINNGELLMDFPSDHVTRVFDNDTMRVAVSGLGTDILELHKGKDDYLALLADEETIKNLNPDFRILSQLVSRGIIATAPGTEVDFVSRCFFPQSGVDEDPTTGSAHTAMTPFWSLRLRKNRMKARQLSRRVGNLECIYKGNRTAIIGSAVTYMTGTISL